MNLKDRVLWTLALIWTKLMPIFLVCSFFFGVHFYLWKELGMMFGWALVISIVTGAATLYGFGKLLRFW